MEQHICTMRIESWAWSEKKCNMQNAINASLLLIYSNIPFKTNQIKCIFSTILRCSLFSARCTYYHHEIGFSYSILASFLPLTFLANSIEILQSNQLTQFDESLNNGTIIALKIAYHLIVL